MHKIFLGTAFSSGKVDEISGEVLPDFRMLVERLLGTLRELEDVNVFCAVEDEHWVLPKDPPEIGIAKDIGKLDDADTFLALVEDHPSAGVQFEIGYALAKGKRVILVARSGAGFTYFNQGLIGAGLVTLITYEENPAAVKDQLAIALSASAD
jgi:hypothetical protein